MRFKEENEIEKSTFTAYENVAIISVDNAGQEEEEETLKPESARLVPSSSTSVERLAAVLYKYQANCSQTSECTMFVLDKLSALCHFYSNKKKSNTRHQYLTSRMGSTLYQKNALIDSKYIYFYSLVIIL